MTSPISDADDRGLAAVPPPTIVPIQQRYRSPNAWIAMAAITPAKIATPPSLWDRLRVRPSDRRGSPPDRARSQSDATRAA